MEALQIEGKCKAVGKLPDTRTEVKLSSVGFYPMLTPVLGRGASHCRHGIGTGVLVITIIMFFFFFMELTPSGQEE